MVTYRGLMLTVNKKWLLECTLIFILLILLQQWSESNGTVGLYCGWPEEERVIA